MGKRHPNAQKPAVDTLFAPGTITLRQVTEIVVRDPKLSPTRRRDFASALMIVAKVLKLPLSAVPADTKWLQKRLEGVAPANLGISRKTWNNTTSNALQALRLVGAASSPFAAKRLSGPWQGLWDNLTCPGPRRALGRFLTFCSGQGIAPDQVTDTTVALFMEVSARASLTKNPDRTVYYLTTEWNRAADQSPGWPSTKLTVPKRRLEVAVPLTSLPPSFRVDLARYLELRSTTDPLDDDGYRLAKSTLVHRDGLIRRFFADLVEGGVAPESIPDLCAMVRPNIVRIGLRTMLKRMGVQGTSKTVYIAASILKSIAKNHALLPEADLDQLRDMCRRLRPRDTGMTAKNRERLRQFDDEQLLAQLLHLPLELLNDARKGRRSAYRDALLVEIGLAIEILLSIPLRIKNLASLHLDRNIQHSRATRDGVCHLVVEASAVKNNQALEFELNKESAALIRIFEERYRPQLVPAQSRWLFGTRDGGGPMDPVVLARRIKAVIRERIGVTVNPHLFRHLAAKLYLDAHPGGYEVVRLMCGHKSLATTIDAYCGREGPAAGKHFDKTIRELRARLPSHSGRQRRKR